MNALSPVRGEKKPAAGQADTAPLAAFVGDDATRAALAGALGADWPATSVVLGGVEQAIAHLGEDPSARYLVVDLSGSEDPMSELDRLAEVCAPGTALIVLGELNDVGLYRTLRSAGVADYLVKPVTSEMLSAALNTVRRRNAAAAAEPEKAPAQSCDVIAVVGARGGAGATTVVTNLGWLFATVEQKRTMIVDFDLHNGAAALALDVEPSRGLCEVLENPDRIDGLFVSSAASNLGNNLFLLCSEEAFDIPTMARPGAVELLAKELRHDFSRVVLDLPRSNIELMRQGMGEANTILIVTDFSLVGLRDVSRLKAFAKANAPMAKVLIVANRVGSAKKGELPKAEVEKAIGATLAAAVPEDSTAVARAINGGKALSVAAPSSKATAALKTLALALGKSKDSKKTNFLARLLAGIKPSSS
ncbi:MAG TPA: AAA family ATPase [Alphaproteobacteria bacterium]